MNYGLYLSAMGVLANSQRQDVIANNLANSETVGFKKDLALFQEQRTEAQIRGRSASRESNELLEPLGGGLVPSGTTLDLSQGPIESTSNPLDVAILGDGYFAVRNGDRLMLTRAGRFQVDRNGILTTDAGHAVLSEKMSSITLAPGAVDIGKDGTITQNGKTVGRLGVFSVPDPKLIAKRGANLMSYPDIERSLKASDAQLRNEALEQANCEPTTELAALMDTQRQLEANANMIRYQDQMLNRLVNDVAKIG
ncbi:MAG TPA: flagellar hook basal-body protein [Tepidisphaeraceae bacterium]|jgi:flagellar basal body rod protein FlgG|nr:flagellar hook basal-body protein [Tepidisphaeraceae bacterium]